MDGYPSWPGIIDGLPQDKTVYEVMVKRHYRVRFFEKNRTSFGLIAEKNITKFKANTLPPMPKKPKANLEAAFSWADYVLGWSPEERTAYFKNNQ